MDRFVNDLFQVGRDMSNMTMNVGFSAIPERQRQHGGMISFPPFGNVTAARATVSEPPTSRNEPNYSGGHYGLLSSSNFGNVSMVQQSTFEYAVTDQQQQHPASHTMDLPLPQSTSECEVAYGQDDLNNSGDEEDISSSYIQVHQSDTRVTPVKARQARSRTSGHGGVFESSDFGDISRIQTHGASSGTARKHGLRSSGVQASQEMAKNDLTRMNRYKSVILQVARELGIDPSIIAGIISRESRAGDSFDRNGYGLMQVGGHHNTLQGKPTSLEHVMQGTWILIRMILGVSAQHRTWTKEQKLKGGICAYNVGVRNVKVYGTMDKGTTGSDYVNDVIARAQWFKKNGY